FVALIFSVVLLAGSWLWELRRWLGRNQKNRADAYNHEIIELLVRAQNTESTAELATIRKDLISILTVSVHDLDVDRISEESFQSLRAIWQIAMDAVREKSALVEAELNRARMGQTG